MPQRSVCCAWQTDDLCIAACSVSSRLQLLDELVRRANHPDAGSSRANSLRGSSGPRRRCGHRQECSLLVAAAREYDSVYPEIPDVNAADQLVSRTDADSAAKRGQPRDLWTVTQLQHDRRRMRANSARVLGVPHARSASKTSAKEAFSQRNRSAAMSGASWNGTSAKDFKSFVRHRSYCHC